MDIEPGRKEEIEVLNKMWQEETEEVKGFSMEKEEYLYIARDGGEKTGYISFFIRGGVCYLRKLYVKPDKRGKGFGKSLMLFAEKLAHEKKCHKLQLKTSEKHKAIGLYKKMGYEIEAEYKNDMHHLTWFMFKKEI